MSLESKTVNETIESAKKNFRSANNFYCAAGASGLLTLASLFTTLAHDRAHLLPVLSVATFVSIFATLTSLKNGQSHYQDGCELLDTLHETEEPEASEPDTPAVG